MSKTSALFGTKHPWKSEAFRNAEALNVAILRHFRHIDRIKDYINKRENINLPITGKERDGKIAKEDPPFEYMSPLVKKGEDSHFSVAITALLIKKGATVNGEAGTSAVRTSIYTNSSLEKLLKLHGVKTATTYAEEENPIVLNADRAKIHEKNGEYAEAAALYLENANMSIQGANELHREHREFFNRQFYDENGNQRPECKYTNDCSDLIRDGILEYTIEHHLNPAIEALANTHDENRIQLMQSTIKTMAQITDDKVHTKMIKAVIAKMQTIDGMDNEITAIRNSLKKLPPPQSDIHILNQTFSPANHNSFASEGLRRRHLTHEKTTSPTQIVH